MSGRQQHYLPQFLQRAFACETRGKETYVAVYKRGRAGPYKSNTRGVGQQRDFYGKQGGQSIDDAITAGESRLADIARAVDSDFAPNVSPQDTALLFSALSMRTKAMRDALSSFAPGVLEAIEEKFHDPKTLRSAIRHHINDDVAINETIDAELAKRPDLSRAQRRYAKKALQRGIRDEYRHNEDRHIAELSDLLDTTLAQLKGQAGAIADRAFLQALRNDPLMPERARHFAEFTLETLCSEVAEPFVLGDCAVWATYMDGVPRLALGDIDDDVHIKQIVLPISPRRCIIGSRDDACMPLSVRQINDASASLSLELFLSNRLNDAGIRALQALIGTALPYLADDAIMQLLR